MTNISVNSIDLEKIKLLDRVLESLTVEELRTLFSHDLLVGKLKTDTGNSRGLLENMVHDYNSMKSRLEFTEGKLYGMENDIRVIVKSMNKPYDPYSQNEMQSLKMKHGAY